MAIAPTWDHRGNPDGSDTDPLNAPYAPAHGDVPASDTLVVPPTGSPAAVSAAVARRQARNDGWLLRLTELCNVATDEAALYAAIVAETARGMGAAAFVFGADQRAFAADDPTSEFAIAAVFHAVVHQRTTEPARVQYMREMALAAPLRAATAAAGYHTLAIVPLTVPDEAPGAFLVAARGDTVLDADVLATMERAAAAVRVAVARIREVARVRAEAEALAAAMRRKDDFLASVSHELRTPLTAILGFAHIIVENDGLGAARRRGMAEDIVASGGLLLTQVNDLLDIVQLGAGRLSVPLSSVDVAAAVQWCARAVVPLMRGKGLTFNVEVPDQLPHGWANKARLEQVVLNLLVNAYKFTPAGGTVTFAAERALDRVVLSVADTGIGIAPEHLARIFEPFERIETEYTRTQSGAGVGLAVARRLVEMMGGTLTVESTPDVGSTFTITVPVSDEQ
jgi:signal transduction histidine kinase